jgi:ferredoxin
VSEVLADREMCIQAGNCVMAAEDVFDQDDDGVVVVLTPEVTGEAEDRARRAVTLCPAAALTLRDPGAAAG